MARRRYGWEKRVKEIARKQKHEEKLKRRQNKNATAPVEEEMPQAAAEQSQDLDETSITG